MVYCTQIIDSSTAYHLAWVVKMDLIRHVIIPIPKTISENRTPMPFKEVIPQFEFKL